MNLLLYMSPVKIVELFVDASNKVWTYYLLLDEKYKDNIKTEA